MSILRENQSFKPRIYLVDLSPCFKACLSFALGEGRIKQWVQLQMCKSWKRKSCFFCFSELVLINANDARPYEALVNMITETHESFENHFSETEY